MQGTAAAAAAVRVSGRGGPAAAFIRCAPLSRRPAAQQDAHGQQDREIATEGSVGSVRVLWQGEGGRRVFPARHGGSARVGQAVPNYVSNSRPTVAQRRHSRDAPLLEVVLVWGAALPILHQLHVFFLSRIPCEG